MKCSVCAAAYLRRAALILERHGWEDGNAAEVVKVERWDESPAVRAVWAAWHDR